MGKYWVPGLPVLAADMNRIEKFGGPVQSTGTGSAYVVAFIGGVSNPNNPPALNDGQSLSFIAHADCLDNATLAVLTDTGYDTRPLKTVDASGIRSLLAGELKAGQYVSFFVNNTDNTFHVVSAITAIALTGGAVEAKRYGAKGDGITDNRAASDLACAAAIAAGVRFVRWGAGNFAANGFRLPAGIVFVAAAGTKTKWSALPGYTGHVIASKDYDSLTQMRIASAVSFPASGSVDVVLTNVDAIVVGHRLAFMKPNYSYYWRGLITAINTSTKTVTLQWQTGAASTGTIGDQVLDLENAGQAECGVSGGYVEGNRDTTIGLSNVMAPQTRGTAGSFALSGDRIWSDGKMRADFMHNTRLRVESTGDNSLRTITIVNPKLMMFDGSIVAVANITFAGPAAGPGGAVYSPLEFIEADGVSIDGAVAGNIWAGFNDGPSAGHGIALFGPRQFTENVIAQKTRGRGMAFEWRLYVESYTDTIATQRGVARDLQVFLADGGGFYLNGPLDCDAQNLCCNQINHRGLEIGRNGLNTRVSYGHVSGAYETSTRFSRPFEGIHILADSCTIVGMASEGSSQQEYSAFANNITLLEAQPFDPNNSLYAPLEYAVGVRVGNQRTGTNTRNLRASIRGYNLSGGAYWFDNDGGYNKCEGTGYDVSGIVSASGLNYVTIDTPTSFAATGTCTLRNTSGQTQTLTVQSVSGNNVYFTTSLTIAAPAGSLLCRGSLYTGNPAATTTIDLQFIGENNERIWRRPGALTMVNPTNNSAELILGYLAGSNDAFLYNRVGATSIGADNVEHIRLGSSLAQVRYPMQAQTLLLNAAATNITYGLKVPAGTDGKAALIIGRASDNASAVDFVNNASNVAYGTILANSSGLTFYGGTTGAFGIDTSGNTIFSLVPTVGTMVSTDNSTKAASTAFVKGQGYTTLASPTFTGIPAAPTAAADTNTTQLATTGFVIGQAASASPLMDSTAAVGTSLRFARQDHVHPSDTSRAALSGATFIGDVLVAKANPGLILNKVASTQVSRLYGNTAGVQRWIVDLGDDVAESGSNAGSRFRVGAFSDAGAYLGDAFNIDRAGRNMTLTGGGLQATTYLVAQTYVQVSGANPAFYVTKTASGQASNIFGQTGGTNRWAISLGNGTAETGANAGSDFALSRYTDAGAFVDSPVFIYRSTGHVYCGQGLHNQGTLAAGIRTDDAVTSTWVGTEAGLNAWTSWTPVFGSAGGALAAQPTINAARYTKAGKRVEGNIAYTFGAAAMGTATGYLTITLPALGNAIANVSITAVDAGNLVSYIGVVVGGAATIRILKYDGSFPSVNNLSFALNFVYEVA